MSSWAEHFNAAATWQMKHELAYWKARAISLEYENKILHDVIRKNCNDDSSSTCDTETSSDTENSESEQGSVAEKYEGNWEVSEEFIEFLVKNAKFKEDARRERERLKAQTAEENGVKLLEAGPVPPENKTAEMKELYGSDWQKIAALEMSMQSNFMQECDISKPSYWPIYPLNFSFGQ